MHGTRSDSLRRIVKRAMAETFAADRGLAFAGARLAQMLTYTYDLHVLKTIVGLDVFACSGANMV